MRFIGIDPGFSGGVSVLTLDGVLEHCFAMPIIKTQKKKAKKDKRKKYSREIDIQGLRKEIAGILEDSTELEVYIELVHSRPEQGVASTFSFGQGYGELIGFFKSFGISIFKVSPLRWKPIMLQGYDRSLKSSSINKAKILLSGSVKPSPLLKGVYGQDNTFSFIRPGCRVHHDGMCESLLIAEYGRQMFLIGKSL